MRKNPLLLYFLLLITCLTAQYPFGGWTTVKIETKLPPNPVEKPCAGKLQGEWKPVLLEDFVPNPNFTSGLNEKKWNLGEFKDDSPCSPKGTSTSDPRNLHAIVNPENPEDGLLQMDANSEKHDSCLNFAGGLGAELMTFSAKEDYRSFWLYPDSYMELRVKQTFGFTLGVGIYLYAAWQPYITEIDFCETLLDPIRNQDSKTWSGNNNGIQDEYSNGYIWGESYQHPNFSCKNKVQVKDMQGKPVNMDGEWLIWGLEWHKNVIRYYLNNVLQREIDLTVPPDCKYAHGQMYYPPQPMAFRFTHNNVTSERNRIPDSVTKSIFVDYIRVYQPTDSLVTKEIYIPKKICQGNGDNISVRYYPDVQYEWSSPAFDFVPKEMSILAHSFCEMQWVSPKSGLAFGTYPVNLKATLPDGRVETQEWWVEYGCNN